jgi:hypothetical protein
MHSFGKALIFKIVLGPCFEKLKYFKSKGGAKILCLEKWLEVQMMT